MASGPQALEKLRLEIGKKPGASDHWVDVLEKLDLCKLRVSDLTAASIDEKKAEGIVSALNRLDLAPLGEAFGIRLRVKFKAWADRDGSVCKIWVEDFENAQWLQSYLCSKLPSLNVTEPTTIEGSPLVRFDVTPNERAPLWRIQKILIECPAIRLMRVFAVRIADRPHYSLYAYNLASWIDDQGEETWWRVDGDPLLMSSLEFPSPPDELAGELRKFDKLLLVSDPDEVGSGEEVVPEELSRLVDSEEFGVRALYLSWQDGSTDWLLIEDEPTSEPSTLSMK
jgi:hypothetical protein